jgi:transposase
MYRIHLTEEQRRELQRRAHAKGVMPRTRDRLEMVRLSDADWSIPRIAVHLGTDERRVRHWIQQFLTGGFDALPDKPHPGQQSSLTPAIREAVRQEIAQGERTWTAGQLGDWIAEQFGVRLSIPHLRRMLRRYQLRYKRTGRGLDHKQKPEEVAPKKAELATLEKRGRRA